MMKKNISGKVALGFAIVLTGVAFFQLSGVQVKGSQTENPQTTSTAILETATPGASPEVVSETPVPGSATPASETTIPASETPLPTLTPTATPKPEKVEFTACHFQIQKDTYAYTGKAITPPITVTGPDAVTGYTVTLKQGIDYTVSYEENTNYGVGRIIVKAAGNYSGYHIEKFGIVPGKVKGVKVKSPFYLENTLTWKKVKGADGYYVYRKKPGGSFQFICNITDGNYQVFHDNVGLKAGKKYAYRIAAYVEDPYDEEVTSGYGVYTKPRKQSIKYNSLYTSTDYYRVKNSTNYYLKKVTDYEYNPYEYSCVTGKCTLAFESPKYGSGSGTATKKVTKKRYMIYTGNAVTDYMVYLTDKKLIKKSMGTDKRVRVIYNWMVKNCTFTKDVKDASKLRKMKKYFKYNSSSFQKKADAYEKKVMKQLYSGKALCIGTSWLDWDRGQIALAYHKGSCSFLTPMFNMLCNGAGVEAHLIDGYYVNKDKSRDYHIWSFVKTGKKYYWYDVPVACKNKSAKETWYKKGTKFWKTCHSWSKRATRGYNAAKFAK